MMPSNAQIVAAAEVPPPHPVMWSLGPVELVILLLVAAFIAGLVVARHGGRQDVLRLFGRGLVSLAWAAPVLALLAYLVLQTTTTVETAPLFVDANRAAVADALDEQDRPYHSEQADDAGRNLSGEPSAELPAWVGAGRVENGAETLAVVSGGQWPTAEQAEQDALSKLLAVVKEDFARHHSGTPDWHLPENVVRAHAIRDQYLESRQRDLGSVMATMHRMHYRVELSPALRQALYPAWREQMVRGRLWQLGALAGFLTWIVGTTAAYFHLDQATAGNYRFRLKLAAVGLIVSGGLLAALWT